MYIYIYIYIYIYMYVCVCTYICTYKYVYIYICTYLCICNACRGEGKVWEGRGRKGRWRGPKSSPPPYEVVDEISFFRIRRLHVPFVSWLETAYVLCVCLEMGGGGFIWRSSCVHPKKRKKGDKEERRNDMFRSRKRQNKICCPKTRDDNICYPRERQNNTCRPKKRHINACRSRNRQN